ncbi:lipoprotein-releasing ABC transporter permease subunit [Chromatiaceae bacterium AAb-1]|nr:lipoprotein-releasing ABC transporter permease subunit [Chromatiaceae bacterium AAb-1]
MQLPVSFFIGLRYSQSRKGNAFISFITLFSVAGIFLGVMALTIVSSVMNGFEAELKKRILGVIPHVVVRAEDSTAWQADVQSLSGVQQITPFLQAEALVQSPRQLTAVLLQGVETEKLPDFMHRALAVGLWSDFFRQRYAVVLGAELAAQLQVTVGEQVRFMLAQGGSFTPMGWVPRQRLFTVTGILDTGSDVDKLIAVTALSDLARLLPAAERQSQWRISLAEPFAAPQIAQQLTTITGIQSVQDWRQTHGKLFDAVAMEKAMMWLMLLLVVAVAAFNIVSALVMMVTDKQSEVAILKTLGMSDRRLFTIFAVQGVSNGLSGALLGAVAGILCCWQLNTIMEVLGLHLASGMRLPVDIRVSQIALIFCSAVGLTLLAVLYPAWRAVKINPAEILRDE